MGDYDYGLDTVTRTMKLSLFPFDATRVESVVSRYNPLRLGQQYRRAVDEAGNLVTYLYANVTSINRHPASNYVTDVSVATLSGRSFSVRARYFVLAAGGIENARLLLDRATGGAHHMGTTRMHQNPRLGVVDANCQMHGLPNLFVAGSSVFPSCGYANPTLTIVALAIRIADRLKQMMKA